ncbi:MAG: HEPN domain-containing protein [Candidatus Micrarchaeaceae archaeon]|jgi:HEPN domain-containing protein|nr:HEPN domain-containing protein [Candidatus Micrarchaeota archaeon]HII10154.1 HEPN domain-containing protein [Candidatus Micrarchaeota archaeon]
MKRVRELVAKASQDFELAKRHKQVKEYVTATILYNRAVEKVLKALFISRTRKEPPKNASIDYLARRTGVPDEVAVYIASLDENEAVGMGMNGLVDLQYTDTGNGAERQAFYMEGLTKRLLDYVSTYTKI